MPVSAYTVARTILNENFDLDTDAVIAEAKSRGVNKPDAAIRRAVNDTRHDMRLQQNKSAKKTPLSAYTLAREAILEEPGITNDALVLRLKARGVTKKDADIREAIRQTRGKLRRAAAKAPRAAAPKPMPVPSAAAVTAPPTAVVATATDPFAGVRLANRTAQACGGIAKAREIVEAIRTVGGLDAFLERLDLVADILGSETKL